MPRIVSVALFALALLAQHSPAQGARCPLDVEESVLVFERVRRVGGGEVPAEVDAYWRDATLGVRGQAEGVVLAVDPAGAGDREVDFARP